MKNKIAKRADELCDDIGKHIARNEKFDIERTKARASELRTELYKKIYLEASRQSRQRNNYIEIIRMCVIGFACITAIAVFWISLWVQT